MMWNAQTGRDDYNMSCFQWVRFKDEKPKKDDLEYEVFVVKPWVNPGDPQVYGVGVIDTQKKNTNYAKFFFNDGSTAQFIDEEDIPYDWMWAQDLDFCPHCKSFRTQLEEERVRHYNVEKFLKEWIEQIK
jgi:hypothetical protein